jgi:hydrophobic/amphiphilic exporter-1 (mainly G- bacteria), HAE1 family
MVSFSIRRPVAVAMVYTAVSLLGVLAWKNLPIELLPDTELPRLTVRANWRGASPETVEAFLTSPLEAEIQQVRGVEKITSTSFEQSGLGQASIEVQFERDTDMEFARLELSERLAALEDKLPAGTNGPFVQQYVPEAFSRQQRTFLSYTVTGPFTLEALRALIDEKIAPEIRQVRGVANVEAYGGRKRLLELELDEGKVRALGLNLGEVDRRVRELEYVKEAGAIRRAGMLYPLALRHRADSIPEILNLALLTDKARIVRVRDVATLHDTYEEPESYYRIDGRPAVAFVITKSIRTNTVDVADQVKARLARYEKNLPAGVRLILDEDQSEGIKLQLTDLRARTIISAVIVFLVLLAFLRSLRTATIAFATIAFSVLITLNMVYFGGFSLNVLTLMGLAMGFGFMVDNAIVVLENIYRRRRTGEDADSAAERGTREVFAAVLGATITNVIVLLPFVYLQGELKLYYVPLALVVGFAQLASLVVGFSFIPALAARALRPDRFVARRASDRGTGIPLYARGYQTMVRLTLRRPWVSVLAALVLLGGSYYVFNKKVTRGVLWRNWFNEDTYISISINQPRGEELSNTDEVARFFENKLRDVDFVERFRTNVFPLNAQIRVTFPDSIENTDAPVVLKEQLSEYAVGFGGTGVTVSGYGPSFGGGGFGGSSPNYSIKILGYNYEQVRDIAEDLAVKLRRFSRIRDVDTNSAGSYFQREKASEIALTIDRDRLALHGLAPRELIREVGAAVQGRNAQSTMRIAGEEVNYAIKLQGYRYLDVVQLRELLLPAPGGELIRLGDVAQLEERRVIGRVIREDQQYQRIVSYEFRGPAKLGDRVKSAVVKSTQLPPGFKLAEDEGIYWGTEQKKQIWGVLAFGVLLIFMVCAALFESVRQPICVLLTVPMALIGVFLTFVITKASFTREAYIGVIMMAGVVVNNAILLVDHVNQLRRKHDLPLEEALVRGASERVRPIIMTTVTTILAMLPLVLFSEAADANIWNALGFAMIGGLTSSTFLVLTVTPALYFLFERRRARKVESAASMPLLEPVGAD